MPLPANNTNAWPYAPLSASVPALADRARYRATYKAPRIAMLRGLMERSAPRAIGCYGLGYREAWSALAGEALHPITVAGRTCLVSRLTAPLVLATPHPVAHGSTSQFWEEVGATLRELAD
jgi:hypothetical protein